MYQTIGLTVRDQLTTGIIQQREINLPSMEPVLTNVTFNHKACHIIW